MDGKVEEREFLELKLRAVEKRVQEEQRLRKLEEERHKAEIRMMLYGAAVFGCIFSAITCVIAAPWWTACAPLVMAWAVLRKAGW